MMTQLREKNTLNVSTRGERELVLTRTFPAPRALVFEALSKPQHIRRWWGQRDDTMTVCEVDFRVGGAWRYVVCGPQGEHGFRGHFREIIAPERIVQTFEWEGMPGHISLETLSLDEHNGQTTLCVVALYDSPEERAGVLTSGMEQGAAQCYDRLEELLFQWTDTNVANPTTRPQLGKADVFLTRTLDAPLDLVWRAWTQAEHLAKWWGPKGCGTRVITLDFRPGGTFHYAMIPPGGNEMYGRFVYQNIAPHKSITFVLSFADAQGNIVRAPFSDTWPLELLCENSFEERDGQTLITMASRPLNATEEEVRAFEQGGAGLREGTNASLDELAAHLASLQENN